jgi:ribosome-associated toxin RatA of RatAB toxin-antitoxin module
VPTVNVDVRMKAPASRVWHAVASVEDYPEFMESVQDVRIEGDDPDGGRLTSWSVLLKGSVLEWTEREIVREEAMRLEFEQVDGDLDRFAGAWSVVEHGENNCTVRLEVDFDIGIPLLADMLNPVAARALHENSEQMLREIERQVASA